MTATFAPDPTVDGRAGAPRVAFAVGRAAGGAVVRNRIRRRLREAARLARPAPGAYLVGARTEAATMGFGELAAHVESALRRASGRAAREGDAGSGGGTRR